MRDRLTGSIRVAGAALVALLLVAPVAGQEQSTEFPSHRIPGWTFTPSVGVGVTYDSNVTLTEPRESVGDAPSDSLFNIIPAGRLEYIGKLTEFSAAYRGFLRRYIETEGLDEFAQRGTIGFNRTVSRRLSFYARDSFADSPTTDEVELTGVPFRRIGSRTNTLAAGLDYRLTKLTTLSSRYDLTWVRFDNPDPLLTGGWIHGVRSELSHALSERLAVGGEYSYRTATLDEGRRDLAFQDGGGVIRFAFGPHTSGSAAAGFATLNDRSAVIIRTGPYFRLSLAHQLELATIGASFERHFVPSFGFGGATSSQELRGYITMPLGRSRMYTHASGGWRRSNPFEADSLELDTMTFRSTLGFAATRWASLEVLYAFARQDSVVTGGEVNRHRIGVQLVISQPLRIR